MTLAARLAALERRHRPETWDVIAKAWGDGDAEAVYIICGRRPGEASRRMTVEQYAEFASDHAVRMLRIYCRGSREGSDL